MKQLLQYLRQRAPLYLLGLSFGIIFTLCFALYRLPVKAVIYPAFLCLMLAAVISLFDYLRIRRKQKLLSRITDMDDIHPDAFSQSDDMIETAYRDILFTLADTQRKQRAEQNRQYADMIDYYTVWAHQIKTPIASMHLHLQNEDSAFSRKLHTDLRRIEQYVEMVLTYLRLDSKSSDYVIRSCELDAIIRQAVKKLSHEFIGRKLRLEYQKTAHTVITDEKWLAFVIEQILSNALKYTQSGCITITVDEKKTLSIHDTGIGIAPEDLPRIFENGFTGYNGRSDQRASGIGLYLCKRICQNLGHPIYASSVLDQGTTILIDLARQKQEFE